MTKHLEAVAPDTPIQEAAVACDHLMFVVSRFSKKIALSEWPNSLAAYGRTGERSSPDAAAGLDPRALSFPTARKRTDF